MEKSTGKYKKSFVKKILARSKEPAKYRFIDKQSFLRQIRSTK